MSKPCHTIHRSPYQPIALTWFFFVMMSCGIEVGNPHDDDSSTTTPQMLPITVAIADAPIDSLSHLYLDIKGVSLVTKNGTELLALSLTEAASAPVDVLSLSDGLTQILVKEQSVPQASYSGFVIELSAEKIGWAVEKDGTIKQVDLPGRSRNYLWITQNFDMTVADQIVLHLDVGQSLEQTSDGNYKLRPVFNPVSTREASSIQGSIAGVAGGVVCSYLQTLPGGSEIGEVQLALGEPPPGDMPLEDQGLRPPPPDDSSHHARVPGIGPRPNGPPPVMGEAPFGECFISTPVHSDGSFRFHFLRPGTYTLRFYPSSGEAVDIKGSFSVAPPVGSQGDTPPPVTDIGVVSIETGAAAPEDNVPLGS